MAGNSTTHITRDMLREVGRAYPQAWPIAEAIRRLSGTAFPTWPSWCFLPLCYSHALIADVVTQRIPATCLHQIPIVNGLATWRMTQSIYRFDPTLYEALCRTPMPERMPVQALLRLPDWCVYIETPGMTWFGEDVGGVWAHMNADPGWEGFELRLMMHRTRDLASEVLMLGCMRGLPLIFKDGDSIADGLAALNQFVNPFGPQGAALTKTDRERWAAGLWPMISLVLYLCADEPDFGSARPPRRVAAVRGAKMVAPSAARVWEVGVRIGSEIRRAHAAVRGPTDSSDEGSPGEGRARAVEPHWRRAHWHSYWIGPRESASRELVPRWLPPTPVNVSDVGALPAIIRPVVG